jgi:hypothetical protein
MPQDVKDSITRTAQSPDTWAFGFSSAPSLLDNVSLAEPINSKNPAELLFSKSIEEPALPDTVTLAEMSEYGYTDAAAMYPLTNERAVELFEGGNPVYLLYPDNTEAMAFDVDEIKVHEGLCGIEVSDWERIQAAETSHADEKPDVNESARASESNAREADLLYGDNPYHRENKFGIYQIRDDIDEPRNFRSASMKELEAHGLTVSRDNYELVYTAPFSDRVEFLTDKNSVLNSLYEQFNIHHPADYSGRSMSVGDVVVLRCNGDITAHFVDSVGFVELSSFTGDEHSGDSFSQVGKSAEKPKEGLRLVDNEPRKAQKTANKGILDELAEAQKLAGSGGKQENHKKSERGYE